MFTFYMKLLFSCSHNIQSVFICNELLLSIGELWWQLFQVFHYSWLHVSLCNIKLCETINQLSTQPTGSTPLIQKLTSRHNYEPVLFSECVPVTLISISPSFSWIYKQSISKRCPHQILYTFLPTSELNEWMNGIWVRALLGPMHLGLRPFVPHVLLLN